MTACALASCSPVAGDAVEVKSGELVINQANTFGFEDQTHWTSTVALSSSTTRTQGARSLGVKAKGYVEVTSAALPSLTGVSGMIGLDVRLPSPQPNPHWYGFVQLLVSVPSKGVNNLFIGQKELTGRPLNQFFPIDFNLPPSLITTLQAGGYNDFRAKIVMNVPSNSTGTYLLDNLHFLPGAVGAADLVETDVLSRWSFDSSDPTVTTLSVLGAGQTFLGSAALRAVTNAEFDFWFRYTAPTPIDIGTNDHLRVVSRALNTAPQGWQVGPRIIIEDASGLRMMLDREPPLLPVDGTTWVDVRVPLAGSSAWVRTGDQVDLHRVRAIEIHADTWDAGYRWDIDAVQFLGAFDPCPGTPASISASATARATTSRVTWSAVTGAVGYNVYRTAPAALPTLISRARGTAFEDFGLSLNTTYRYEVRAIMPARCESGSGVANVTTRTTAAGLTRVPTLKVLVPFYLNAQSVYTPAEIVEVKDALELARQFYYRNSRGRLNLVFDYMEINAPTPPTAGPTMEHFEPDLSARGIGDDQYDVVFPVARDLNGCWGGFVLLGRTAGAFGADCGNPYPAQVSDLTASMAWNFTHEFQHSFDFVVVNGSGQDMIHGHPDVIYQDMPYFGPIIDAGEHWDWEGMTLRTFNAYMTLAAPYSDYIEIEDPDADGLASSDTRLPVDEARFGSNASLADTDADGLADMGEYAAGRFASSSPVTMDTDGDGLRDNVDPTPRQNIPSGITAATPVIDGICDASYTLFRAGTEFTAFADFTALTYLAYDASNIYVCVQSSRADATMRLLVDGSGANGFWHGDDSYSFTLTPNGSLLNWTHRHSTEGGESRAIPGSDFRTINFGSGAVNMEARIPRTNLGQGYGWTGGNTNGFSTAVGSVLGIRILFTDFGTGELFGEPWATQTEHFHFDDVTLR